MKTKLVFFTALFTFLLVACEKDKFTTIPQVKAKSISPEEVNQGDIINMQSSFTDEEGDVDSVYVVLKWWNGNISVAPSSSPSSPSPADTLRYSFENLKVPIKTREGDLFIKFAYGVTGTAFTYMPFTPVTKDTSCSIGVLLIDKEKNRSEYSESDKIRLIKP
jgi:hypothetical protein